MAFRLFALGVVMSLAASVGCSGGGEVGSPPVTDNEILNDIKYMYDGYTKDHRKTPRKLSDFDHPYEPGAINGYAALRDGQYVFLWGGSLPGANAAQTVLAYGKEVPEKGGSVLFQDGTIRQVTAAEFGTAPKVK